MESGKIKIIHANMICSSCGTDGHVAVECPDIKGCNDLNPPDCSKELEIMRQDWTNKVMNKVFDSKKGDTVRILKTNGTEQVWRCIQIKYI